MSLSIPVGNCSVKGIYEWRESFDLGKEKNQKPTQEKNNRKNLPSQVAQFILPQFDWLESSL